VRDEVGTLGYVPAGSDSPILMRILKIPPRGALVETAFRWEPEEARGGGQQTAFSIVISNVKALSQAHSRSRAQAICRCLQVLTKELDVSLNLTCDCAASFVVAHLYHPKFSLMGAQHSVSIAEPDFTGR
jgi:hypothetical protein